MSDESANEESAGSVESTRTVAVTGEPPPHRRMRPRGPARRSAWMDNRGLMRLLRNGGWLLLPIVIPELFLRSALPLSLVRYTPDFPLFAADGVLQLLMYGGAFLLLITPEERVGRMGIACYAIGVTATVSAWVVGVVGAPRAPGLECPAGVGVTAAPLLCFLGMALLSRHPLYALGGLVLTLVRLFSTLPAGLCA